MSQLSKKPLILVGGGGHCHSCIDVIEQEENYEIFGIIDTPDRVGKHVMGYPIIGTDYEIEKWTSEDFWFLNCIGYLPGITSRFKLSEFLKAKNAQIATIISPRAYVSAHAEIQKGSIVMHNAVINANAKIGESCIINSGAIIEHDVQIGDYCHISTAAVINGGSILGNHVFVGSSACIHQALHIVNNVVIGAMTNINKNLTQTGVYVGNPYKILRPLSIPSIKK